MNSNKPVYPVNVYKPVCSMDVYKPLCPVDISKPFLVDYWKHEILLLILSFFVVAVNTSVFILCLIIIINVHVTCDISSFYQFF